MLSTVGLHKAKTAWDSARQRQLEHGLVGRGAIGVLLVCMLSTVGLHKAETP